MSYWKDSITLDHGLMLIGLYPINHVIYNIHLFLPTPYVSTRGGYIFSLFVCSHLGGGGVPHPADGWGGGTPSQLQVGGSTPSHIQAGGGTSSHVQVGGSPFPGPRGGYPFPGPGRGYPPPRYLLHRGRYASCVHAGLSFKNNFCNNI